MSFTVAEARAILIADEGLVASYEARLVCGSMLGIEERSAWRGLVERAAVRVAEFEKSDTPAAELEVSDRSIAEVPRG